MLHTLKIPPTRHFAKTRSGRTNSHTSNRSTTRLRLETLEERITPTTNIFPLAGAGANAADLSQASAVTTDASGNVYVTGTFSGTQNFGGTSWTAFGASDAFVAKYSATGTLLWVDDFGGLGATVNATAIAVDSAGDVYTTGDFEGSAYFNGSSGLDSLTSSNSGSDLNVYVSKLNTNGNYVYAGVLGSGSSADATGIAVNASDDIYITGYFQGTGNFDPGSGTQYLTTSSAGADTNSFVSELNADGSFAFADLLGSGGTTEAQAIALDASGNVYTTGWFSGSGNFNPAGSDYLASVGGINSYVSKLSSNGTFEFAEIIGWGANSCVGSAIAINSSGDVITTGSFSGMGNFSGSVSTTDSLESSNSGADTNAFVSELTTSGQYVFATDLGSGSPNAAGTGVAVDAAGDIYITGSFVGTGNFAGASATDNLTSSNSGSDTNTFMTRLSSSGQFLVTFDIGSGSPEATATGIAVDTLGNVYTVGTFTGTGSFFGGGNSQTLESSDSGANNSFFLDQIQPPFGIVVADFKGYGLFEYSQFSGWTRIIAVDPISFQTDAARDVFAVFSSGLFEYAASTGTWALLAPTIPNTYTVAAGGDVIAEFQNGLWSYNSSTGWLHLNTVNPTTFTVDSAGAIFADYHGNGLWAYTSASGWARLITADPISFAVDPTGKVFADFRGYGLWEYTSASGWVCLNTVDPTSFTVDSADMVFADYRGSGLYVYSSGLWISINSADPTSYLVNESGDVVADYAGYGLFEDTGLGWVQLTTSQPTTYTEDAEGDVYADFQGEGVWMYDVWSGVWLQLSPANSTNFLTAG